MDLSSIANITSGFTSVGSQSGSVGTQSSSVARQNTADAATHALTKAAGRTEQKLESTKVQLSAFGQIKGALAEVLSASEALSAPKSTATADEALKSVENFVSAYNKANTAISNATRNSAKESGALADDARARKAGNDLRRSVSEAGGQDELRKAGITQNKDGSLSVDKEALDKALKEAPAETTTAVAAVGARVEATAARELGSGGNVGAPIATLNERSQALETQQRAQQALVEAAQRSVAEKSTNVTQAASFIAAYQRNFLG